MKKFKIEVPVCVFLSVTIEAENEDDALESIHGEFVYKTATGGLASVVGSLSVSLDAFNWGKSHIEEVNG